MLCSGDLGRAYVSTVLTDCFVYLFIIMEKRSLDSLQVKDQGNEKAKSWSGETDY